MESPEFIQERVEAYTSVHEGLGLPEISRAYWSARHVNLFLRKGQLEGLKEDAARILRENLSDNFNFREIATAATADLRNELAERLAAGDPDTYSLALLYSSIRETELRAGGAHFLKAMGELDPVSKQLVEAKLEPVITQMREISIDYALLAVDAPNYVREKMQRYVDGPSKTERAFFRALQPLPQSTSSGAIRIEANGDGNIDAQ